MLTTRSGFDVQEIVEVVRRERADLRALERQEGVDEDRVMVVVKLRPRYRPERMLDILGHLEGVRYVEWEH